MDLGWKYYLHFQCKIQNSKIKMRFQMVILDVLF